MRDYRSVCKLNTQCSQSGMPVRLKLSNISCENFKLHINFATEFLISSALPSVTTFVQRCVCLCGNLSLVTPSNRCVQLLDNYLFISHSNWIKSSIKYYPLFFANSHWPRDAPFPHAVDRAPNSIRHPFIPLGVPDPIRSLRNRFYYTYLYPWNRECHPRPVFLIVFSSFSNEARLLAK